MTVKVTVGEIMSKDVFTVDVDDTVKKAEEIMRNEQVRHVPVLDGNKFFGLITERSIMEYTLRQIYEFDNIDGEVGMNRILDYEKILTHCDHVIFPEDSVQKAIKLMTKHKIDCLPVLDWENHLVGILSSIDVLLFVNRILEIKG